MSAKKYIVEWDELESRCKTLCDKILKSGQTFTKILAVTRGGAVPAGIIAYQLNIKNIDTIAIETYGGEGDQKIGDVKLLKSPRPDYLKDTLVIDDLVDTGTTFKYLRDRSRDCTFLAVYAKPQGAELADMYDHKIPQNTWVYFPWDEKP